MPPSQKRYGRGRVSIGVSPQNAVGKTAFRTKSPTIIGFQPPSKAAPMGGCESSPPTVPQRPGTAGPPTPVQAPQGQSLATRPIEPRPVPGRQRMGLADALRKHGIDEQKLAALYAYVVDFLKERLDDRGADKLLVQVLKECREVFQKENSPGKSEWRAASIPIVVHNIPRPERGPQSGGDNNGSA